MEFLIFTMATKLETSATERLAEFSTSLVSANLYAEDRAYLDEKAVFVIFFLVRFLDKHSLLTEVSIKLIHIDTLFLSLKLLVSCHKWGHVRRGTCLLVNE